VRKSLSSDSFTFTAKLVRVGTLYAVDVPAAVTSAVGIRGFVPIDGILNGDVPFRASLVPRGGGRHRIFLNSEVRAAGRARLGNRVAIQLRVEREPRHDPIPEDIREALCEAGVLATFESFTVAKRRHILRWVDKAVHETTRAKRVTKIVEATLEEHEKRVDRAHDGS
jgi:hypothetical protein